MYDKLKKKSKKIGLKLVLIVTGVFLYSIGLKWFVYPANILPAGFTGVSILLQRIFIENFDLNIPITVYNVILNLIPAIYCFRIVGKKFTVFSFGILFFFTFIADAIPSNNLTSDPIVAAIFGGILCGFGASLWFRCGLSGGGTDFIAMAISAKYHVKTFGYILAFNIILIMIQGVLYGWDYAFYSMICQYVGTQAINIYYRHYEARTLLIITNKPDEIAEIIINKTKHSSTRFDGVGAYTKNNRTLLYTVVTQPEVRLMTGEIRKCDPDAFINIINSNDIHGSFNYLPVDIDDIDSNYSLD